MIYACADIHGQLELWNQVKDYLNKEDTLIFLGDVIDRGRHGIRILREMMQDPRVVFLKGNHEDMLLDLIESHRELRTETVILENGGYDTINSFYNLCQEDKDEIYHFLQNLPYECVVEGEDGVYIHCCHAGTTPTRNIQTEQFLLWNRDHFKDKWPTAKKYKHHYEIHGHTPIGLVPYVQYEEDGVTYCNGHKINLDTGCYATGVLPLYNITKMKLEIVFKKGE